MVLIARPSFNRLPPTPVVPAIVQCELTARRMTVSRVENIGGLTYYIDNNKREGIAYDKSAVRYRYLKF